MKTLLLLTLFAIGYADEVAVDAHVIKADFAYPKRSEINAGTILTDKLYILNPYTVITIDESMPVLDAKITIDPNYLTFKTPFLNIAIGIQNLGSLYQDINYLALLDTYFVYNNREILLSTQELSLDYAGVLVEADNTHLTCENYSIKKGYSKSNTFVDCLNKAKLAPKDESKGKSRVHLKFDHYNVELNLNQSTLQLNALHIDAQSINFRDESQQFLLFGLEAYCSKEGSILKLDPKMFLSGCFKESYINLENFEMKTPNTNLNSKVELINIAGSRLRLSLPTTDIRSNDDLTSIHNLKISCKNLIQDSESITLDNLITGCLESATLNATSLTSASVERKEKAQNELLQGANPEQLKKAGKGFGIEDFSLLELTASNGNITLLGKVKLLFLNPEFRVTGHASYEDKVITLDIDDVLIAGFIPVKKLILYLLEKFIPQGNISVEGTKITIKL